MDSVDKIIDTAKKLRRYTKKVTDPAFANLVADLNMALADLKLELAGLQPAKTAPSRPAGTLPITTTLAPNATSPSAQLSSNFDSVFGDDPDRV